MTPDAILFLIPLYLVLAVLIPLVRVVGGTYMRFRHDQLVTCPGTGEATLIHIDPASGARAALLSDPRISVKDCLLWPQRNNCAQGCLNAVHLA
jgi:hypothetical protein